MNYEDFWSFLADAEATEYCSVLIAGQWLEITDWDNTYANDGLVWCRARNRKTGPGPTFVKTLIVLSEIQAVQSDAP